MTDRPNHLRVLLVEDNPGDARLLQEQLADANRSSAGVRYDATVVDRLEAALQQLEEFAFDVVLLDLTLPDASGTETCRRLLEHVPACPPVIVLTGNADHRAATDAVAAGAQDYLVKGTFDTDLLMRSIEYARERHRARLQLEQALARETEIVDRLQELDRLKTRFVAMASHELRTPLASIAGFSATLRERWEATTDEDRLAYIRIIDDQSARLTRLVDDLLVLSRIESGSLDASPGEVSLHDVVQAVVTDLDAHERGIEVSVEPSVRVLVDPDHLEQMLLNYMSNALKYGDAPITVHSRPHGDSYVDVLVRDRGDGVPDDVAPLLFEEFVRGRGHSAARIPGTGLGLSIVRGLARAQGGDAWHEPNEPSGSVFALRLPTAPT